GSERGQEPQRHTSLVTGQDFSRGRRVLRGPPFNPTYLPVAWICPASIPWPGQPLPRHPLPNGQETAGPVVRGRRPAPRPPRPPTPPPPGGQLRRPPMDIKLGHAEAAPATRSTA